MTANKKHKTRLIKSSDGQRRKLLWLLLCAIVVLFACLTILLPSPADNAASPAKTLIGPFSLPLDADKFSTAFSKKSLPDPFPRVAGLENQKAFWKAIFTQYTRQDFVIHDSWYVTVTYDVIKTKTGDKNRWLEPRERQAHFRELLKAAADQWDTPQKMTSDVQKMYRLFEKIEENANFPKREAYKRIRVQMGQADSFRIGIAEAGRWIPEIGKILKEHGLPVKLSYLPLIESAYNPRARSFAGAAGMWQLMPFVGKHYGLCVDHMVDERQDPISATHAAAQHLSGNYAALKSWPLAITAYNHGLGGMKNAVKTVGSTDIWKIAREYKSRTFGFASRNFYAEFLAAIDILDNPHAFYNDLVIRPPTPVERFRLKEYVSIQTLEDHCGIPARILRSLNPAIQPAVFSEGAFIPQNTTINIPKEQAPFFIAAYRDLPNHLRFRYIKGGTHKVRKGQAISHIARKYGTTVSTIKQINGIRKARRLRHGSTIKLPGKYIAMGKTDTLPPKRPETPETPEEPEASEKLEESETSETAETPKTDSVVAQESPPKHRNNRDRSKIEKPKLADLKKHRVRRGETLIQIANRYGIPVKLIARQNRIEDTSEIKYGQVLTIPEG